MLAPALTGVPIPPGRHRVTLVYQPYRWYLPCFLLAAIALLTMWAMERRSRARVPRLQ